MLPHLEAFHFLMYQPFYHLTESLRQGTNVGLQCVPGDGSTLYHRLESSAENKRIFYGWMKSIKHGSVPARLVDALRGCRHVLDVGGGDGDNAIDLAREVPGLKVTIIDLADTCALAAGNVAKAGLSERIAVSPGNFLEDPLPRGADAILFAHISNIYSDETNQALVEKAADALPKGGKLILFNLISNDDQTGPWYAGFMSLYFQVLATGTGAVYPPSRYEAWFANAGFESLAIHTGVEGIFVGGSRSAHRNRRRHVGRRDLVELRRVLPQHLAPGLRRGVAERAVDLLAHVAVQADRVRVVGLEQDVVLADRVHQLARRVLFEDVTAVDLAVEVLARLERELRVRLAHLRRTRRCSRRPRG